MSHVEKRYDVFYSSRDYCVMWTLWVVKPFVKHYTVRFSGLDLAEVEILRFLFVT